MELYAKLTKCKSKVPLLQQIVEDPNFFRILRYNDALKELEDSGDFEANSVTHGMDLSDMHERYLARSGPVFITHWPASIKPFYVRTEGQTEALAVDLLMPEVGELVGGSLREHRSEVLRQKTQGMEGLDWYMEMRDWGSSPTAGFGLGLERLVQLIMGTNNIRDTLPFPRAPHMCKL